MKSQGSVLNVLLIQFNIFTEEYKMDMMSGADLIRYFVVDSGVLVVPLVMFLSIFFCQRYYDRLDKKVFWLVGFFTGVILWFFLSFYMHPLEWWIFNNEVPESWLKK